MRSPAGSAAGTGGPEAGTVSRRARAEGAALVVLAVLVVLVAGGARAASTGHEAPPGSAAMPMLGPDGVLDLATVSPAVAAEYHYAADHTDAYRQMRCWCGCEKAFGHRSLADCFVRPDGAWEAHGAGCGVCTAEAMTARKRLDAGDNPALIARDLDARFGRSPTAPTGA